MMMMMTMKSKRLISSQSFETIISAEMLTIKNSNYFQYIYEKIREDSSEDLFENFSHLTARNVAINELITSEQRFVDDMKNILKVELKRNLEFLCLEINVLDLYNTDVRKEDFIIVTYRCSFS